MTAALRRCGFEGSQGIDHVLVDGAACPVLLADLTTCVGQALALNWLSSPHVVGLFIAPPVEPALGPEKYHFLPPARLAQPRCEPLSSPMVAKSFQVPTWCASTRPISFIIFRPHCVPRPIAGVWCWPWKIREAASSGLRPFGRPLPILVPCILTSSIVLSVVADLSGLAYTITTPPFSPCTACVPALIAPSTICLGVGPLTAPLPRPRKPLTRNRSLLPSRAASPRL